VAEVSGKGKSAPAGIHRVLLFKQLPGTVSRTVIHTDHFVIHPPGRRRRVQSLEQLRQNRFFVEAGYYDGNSLHRRVAVLASKLVVVFWLHLAAILEFMIRLGLEKISDVAHR
jgi:hypothetical protein